MQKLLFLLFFLNSSVFAQTYRNPVIAGDFPDPTVIRVGENYYAAGTTSDFAPVYPLYHSRDLVNWKLIGSIFNEMPDWVKGDCWAPELYYHNETYFAYYTARRKSDNITCIGVATTKDISQGFTDQGILIEWGNEAIDAYIFKDDDGKLYISWKAYGLDERPIEILASELSDDGMSLVGEHFSLTRHDKGWEGSGDEGQCIVKHRDYYYLFYSVGGCCDNRCDYRVRVARSKSIKGDWVQYENNPILQGGDLWNCTGHGTLVQTPDNRYFYLYHAYQKYDFEFVGRQALLDQVLWNEETGWPYFKNGNIPSTQTEVPFKGTVQKKDMHFHDSFNTDDFDKYWLHDVNLPVPELLKDNSFLIFINPGEGISFRGINPKSGIYNMETSISNEDQNFKGLCVYGNKSNLVAWGIEDKTLKLYEWRNGVKKELFSKPCTATQITFKVESRNARLFRFYWSENGKDWEIYSELGVDGSFLPQWGKGVRAGLVVETKNDSKMGKFLYFDLQNK